MINVLLIDDDEDEFFIFTNAIKVFSAPMRCIYAASAVQSFEILRNFRPDIILVDMNMPMMNGLDCIKQLKAMHEEDVPLIVLYSTHMDKKLCGDAKLAGAAGCLQKTTSIEQLSNKLSPFLSHF